MGKWEGEKEACLPSLENVPLPLCFTVGLVKNTFSTLRTFPIPIDSSDSTVKESHDMMFHSITGFLAQIP